MYLLIKLVQVNVIIIPLLEYVAQVGKPIILSTGMNGIERIRKAVNIFRKYKISCAFLHCTSIYPKPPQPVRLAAIQQLIKEFSDAVVGLSDHIINNLACLGAVALGASILKRHFTDRMDRPGPDIVCSMDPKALKELIEGSEILKLERGGEKGYVKEEQPTIDFAYASVVTIKDIMAGEELNENNIWVKRPGTGEILAEHFKDLLGKKAVNNLSKDVQVNWTDFK